MGVYGVTKFFGEQIGFQFYKIYGIDFVSVRFSGIYGPGRLLKNPNSPMVIPCRIIENAMLGKSFRHPKGREQKNDFIYYKDVSQGVLSACFAKKLTHRVFNIGTGVGSTLLNFTNAVKKIFPEFEADIGPGLDYLGIGFNTYCIYDISRAKDELGYNPQYSIDDGVADYIQTMRKLNISPTFVR
jgi:UDP-glucose 4-epimerase